VLVSKLLFCHELKGATYTERELQSDCVLLVVNEETMISPPKINLLPLCVRTFNKSLREGSALRLEVFKAVEILFVVFKVITL
jgi:hypothetical protein